MSAHTRGPWKLETESRSRDGSGLVVTDSEGGYTVAVFRSPCGVPDVEEAEANARLGAAAPDLLEALKACRVWVALATGRDPKTTHPKAIENAERDLARLDAAIAKAEGR